MHPHSIARSRSRSAGSTFLIALLMLTVLVIAGAGVVLTVSTRYNYTQKAVGWNKALSAAEAGADFGMANCRRTFSGSATSPWTGWKKSLGSYSWGVVTNAADANAQLALGNKLIYDLPSALHLAVPGEGAADLWFHVEVDAPASMTTGGNQWYRIRSTGYTGLPGLARSGNDNPSGAKTHNDILRKMDMRSDHFIMRYGDYANPRGSTVTVSPQATRRIETTAKPATPFSLAMFATSPTGSPMSMPLVDSYNSTDTVNYPGGLYSSAPRNPSTGVGCNGNVYINAPVSSLSTQVYGSVATNGGTLTMGNNITGAVDNHQTESFPPVVAPSWAASVVSSPLSSVVAGTSGSPGYYSWSSINNLTVTLPSGNSTGVVNIYVSGDVTGGITVSPGVTLKIWFAGNFSMKARDLNNLNNNAAFLQLYGINPPAGQTRTVNIESGNPGYSYFVLDSPGHDFSVNGNPDICGAIIAKTIVGNGNTTWHYDEALGTVGQAVDYKRGMWVEDPR